MLTKKCHNFSQKSYEKRCIMKYNHAYVVTRKAIYSCH